MQSSDTTEKAGLTNPAVNLDWIQCFESVHPNIYSIDQMLENTEESVLLNQRSLLNRVGLTSVVWSSCGYSLNWLSPENLRAAEGREVCGSLELSRNLPQMFCLAAASPRPWDIPDQAQRWFSIYGVSETRNFEGDRQHIAINICM